VVSVVYVLVRRVLELVVLRFHSRRYKSSRSWCYVTNLGCCGGR